MKKSILKWMASFLLCSTLLTLDLSFAGYSYSGLLYANDTLSVEANLNREVKEALDRLEQKKQQIATMRQNSVNLTQRIALLKEENISLKEQYEKIQEQLEMATRTLEQRQKEYQDALDVLEEKKDEYNYRISTMFYYYNKSPWELLLESKGLNGFFGNLRLMNIIASTDKKSLDELKLYEEVAKNAEKEADRVFEEFQTFSKEKEKELDQLEAGILSASSQLSEMNSVLENSNHDLAKLQADLAQKQAAYAAFKSKQKNYNIEFVGGGAVWPLPAGHQITSPYGQRFLEFDRVNNNYHTGTDMAGPAVAGTPVVAAWPGYVANVHYPYPGALTAPDANYVQLTHGNGIGTGYWHLQTITVAEGQFVAQGAIIGTCGSTGNSQGPHLHFEVYDPNSPHRGLRDTIDPMTVLGQ